MKQIAFLSWVFLSACTAADCGNYGVGRDDYGIDRDRIDDGVTVCWRRCVLMPMRRRRCGVDVRDD